MSSLVKSVGTIGGLTLVSRIFGFARDMLLSRILGAGGVADAWQLAFQLPNIFRRLFAEGAFAAAFVPLFNQRMTKDGDASEARAFAEAVLAVLIPILIVFSALMLIVMPWVMGLFASDALEADGARFDLAVAMARIAFPYLALMSVATLFAAILNSLSRFAAAAAAPILLNLCLIAALLLGMFTGDGSEEARAATGLYLAIAVSLSGLFQLGWLYYWVRRSGFRPGLRRPRLTAGVREMGVLILPAVFGAGVYQISRFVETRANRARIRMIEESEPLGTAGALGHIDADGQAPILVINGDVITSVDLVALHDFHIGDALDATIGVARYDIEVPFGVVRSNEEGLFEGIDEKPRISKFVAAGVYYLSAEIAALVAKDRPLDMPDLLNQSKNEGLKIGIFPIHEYWTDVGRLADLEAAVADHKGKKSLDS